MTLADYLLVLLRRKWVIIITIVLAVGVASLRVFTATPTYTASTTIRVPTAPIGSADYIAVSVAYSDRLMNTYQFIATSSPVISDLQEFFDTDDLPFIRVETAAETELLRIHVVDENAEFASQVSNKLAQLLIDAVESNASNSVSATEILQSQLEDAEGEVAEARAERDLALAADSADPQTIAEMDELVTLKENTYFILLEQYQRVRSTELTQVRTATIVEPAGIPSQPSNTDFELLFIIAGGLGATFGIALAFLLDSLDPTLRTRRQIEEATQLPIIGMIPTTGRRNRIISNGRSTQFVEAHRDLRTNLQLALDGQHNDGYLLTVVSSEVGAGKTSVVANLGIAFAKSGQRILLLDMDLRRSNLSNVLKVPNENGFVDYLHGDIELDEAIQTTSQENLFLLPRGPKPEDPLALITAAKTRDMLVSLAKEFDLILIDTPSLGVVTDAKPVIKMSDATLIVIRENVAKPGDIHALLEQLAAAKSMTLGVVVNQSKHRWDRSYYVRH